MAAWHWYNIFVREWTSVGHVHYYPTSWGWMALAISTFALLVIAGRG